MGFDREGAGLCGLVIRTVARDVVPRGRVRAEVRAPRGRVRAEVRVPRGRVRAEVRVSVRAMARVRGLA